MKLGEIHAEWEKNCKIDKSELGMESLRVSELHSKYLKMLSMERKTMLEIRARHDQLTDLRKMWWQGKLSPEDMQAQKWEINPLRVMGEELPLKLKADPVIVQSALRIGMQEEKISVLVDILKSINGRQWQITGAQNWLKFVNGSN